MLQARVLPDASVTLQLCRHDSRPWALLSSSSVDHHSHWHLGPCPVHTHTAEAWPWIIALHHCFWSSQLGLRKPPSLGERHCLNLHVVFNAARQSVCGPLVNSCPWSAAAPPAIDRLSSPSFPGPLLDSQLLTSPSTSEGNRLSFLPSPSFR